MQHVALIACSSKKLDEPAPARDLYQSALFRKSLSYVQEVLEPDCAFVLSAKHHLLPLDQVIEPYDVTLNEMSAAEIRDWSSRVLAELEKETDTEEDRFTFLAGQTYRRYLVPELVNTEVPMEGLRIGEQLQFLSEAVTDE